MSTADSDKILDQVTRGVQLAIKRLIEQTKKDDGHLVVSKGGKVVTIKARELQS